MDRTKELGTKPVGKLLMQYAVPAIIAMTASSLYNMVDSIFIGQIVGPLAIAGLAITFPLMNISTAIGAAIGVGASTMISVRLGQKNTTEAQHYFGNAVTMKIITGLLFGLISLLFLDPILRVFGASDQTLPYAREYMIWILYGNVITHLYFGLNGILRSAGHPKTAMYATIVTVVLNTILDPLFIIDEATVNLSTLTFNLSTITFTLHGLGLGIKGAAIATVLSQAVSLVWQLKIFSNKAEIIHFESGIYRLRKKIVGGILAIGMSPFLMHFCSCFVVLLINRGMLTYGGDLAVGAYGIVNRFMFLFAMFTMGLNQGMQPIAGYNYGAQLMPRVHEVLRKAIFYASIAMTTGWLIAELIPHIVLRLFTSDEALLAHAIHGMRIFSAAFPIIGFQMVTSNYFQSIGQAKKSIYLSLTRQLIFLIPGLLILPLFFGLDGVWLAIPVSDVIACINAAYLLYISIKGHQMPHQRLFRKHKKMISITRSNEENWPAF